MSGPRDPRRQGGFTLIEVMVALGIIVVVAAAVAPLTVSALRAGYGAKLYTQAKNIAQQQVEGMRNLQYHIDASSQKDASGASIPAARLDLLDTYYPALTPTAAAATNVATAPAGWVAAGVGRAAGEPASGSFYRWTKDVTLPNDKSAFHVVVDTQFLNSSTGGPVNPPTGYNYADTTGMDAPASTSVGVTVFVTWTVYGAPKQEQTYTRIDSATPQQPLTTSQAQALAIDVTSTSDPNTGLEAIVGQVNADGSSAVGSLPNSISSATSSVNAVGASASQTPGPSVQDPNSPATAGSAPQVSSVPSSSESNGDGLSGCGLICYGKTSTVGGPVTVTQGLPVVGAQGSGGSPITASVAGNGNSTGATLSFANNANVTNLGLAAGPLVLLAGSGGAPVATGGAGITTTAGASHSVSTQASACFTASPCPTSGGTSSTLLEVMPTSFAPNGVIQIQLIRASISCVAGTSAPSTSADYQAHVWYWNGSGYVKLGDVQPGNTVDPLPDPTTLTVGVYNGTVMHLSDYIQSWGSALSATTANGVGGNTARTTLGGVVTVTTQPTRSGDSTSAISVKVGVLACYALDSR